MQEQAASTPLLLEGPKLETQAQSEAVEETREDEPGDEVSEWWHLADQDSVIEAQVEEPTAFFVPPEIEELRQTEEEMQDSLNEAMDLYEQVAHSLPGHFVQFYNHTRATRVRMSVNYTLPGDDGEVISMKVSPSVREMFPLPDSARFIQIDFEYSSMGMGLWKPVSSFKGLPQTYSYSAPATRRFFVAGFRDNVHISQIRDEYEQLVQE